MATTDNSFSPVSDNNCCDLDLGPDLEKKGGKIISYPSLVAGIIISSLTFFGQVTVFVAYAQKKELRTPTNYFMLALSMADFLISTICLPGWTLQVSLGYWPLNYILCDIWNVCDYAFASISIYTVLFITLDRFLAIKFPLRYSVKRTPFRAKMALVIIWATLFLANFIFIFTTQYIYGQGRPEGECVTYYLEESLYLGFGMIFFLTWFPTVTAFICYVMIWFSIRKSVRFSGQSSGNMPTSIPSSDASTNTIKNINLTEKELKALKTMSFVLAVFVISCLPLSFIFSLATVNPASLDQVWIEVAYWMMYLNSTFNPVCYCLGNSTYRHALLEFFCPCCYKDTDRKVYVANPSHSNRKAEDSM